MPHMIPEYAHDVFVTIEYAGNQYSFPKSDVPKEYEGFVTETHPLAYWARLSAPCYLDCTEWEGPYADIEDARDYIMDTYDVDPITGESCWDAPLPTNIILDADYAALEYRALTDFLDFTANQDTEVETP